MKTLLALIIGLVIGAGTAPAEQAPTECDKTCACHDKCTKALNKCNEACGKQPEDKQAACAIKCNAALVKCVEKCPDDSDCNCGGGY